ncbi:hypothetical protein Taro_047009, partial [Colocasia esculenta]|nr:hypothetical protein [Colocasia esculenta]
PKGKACLGAHADTQTGHGNNPRQHRHCRAPTGRRDAISIGKGAATIALTRRGGASQQPLCRDGKQGRDSTPYRDAIRSHPTRATPLLMSRRRLAAGCSIPGRPQTTQTPTHGEGSMGKAVRLSTKPRGIPIHPDGRGHKKSLPFTKNEPMRGPSCRLATSSSFHARPRRCHEPAGATTP